MAGDYRKLRGKLFHAALKDEFAEIGPDGCRTLVDLIDHAAEVDAARTQLDTERARYRTHLEAVKSNYQRELDAANVEIDRQADLIMALYRSGKV
jgi:hypothetical protein